MAKKRAGKKGTSKRKVKRTPKAPSGTKPAAEPGVWWVRNRNGLRIVEHTGTKASLKKVLKGLDATLPRMAPHRV